MIHFLPKLFLGVSFLTSKVEKPMATFFVVFGFLVVSRVAFYNIRRATNGEKGKDPPALFEKWKKSALIWKKVL